MFYPVLSKTKNKLGYHCLVVSFFKINNHKFCIKNLWGWTTSHALILLPSWQLFLHFNFLLFNKTEYSHESSILSALMHAPKLNRKRKLHSLFLKRCIEQIEAWSWTQAERRNGEHILGQSCLQPQECWPQWRSWWGADTDPACASTTLWIPTQAATLRPST